MNNEPVAWMNSLVKWDIAVEQDITHDIPLYTHPVKELTDEEIKSIWCEVYDFKGYDCLTELDYKFCREIIRKAQEK